MAELAPEQFGEFFEALHGYAPFPWQEALAKRVCAGDWPEVIDLPTAAGKTAFIDIALFAMAIRTDVPRRVFFVVDRRIVVNEAYLRTCEVRDKLDCALRTAETSVLHEVAERLARKARGDRARSEVDSPVEPLLVSEMRGGIFRDETWVRNPLQPTVITSTVDQVGSRLLFRGYGVSENSRPIHAGLIANDALLLLDEAHCSRAFAQTLKRIEAYRGKEWANRAWERPFRFVQMTATPAFPVAAGKRLGLSGEDRATEVLKQRLQARKPTQLIEIKGKKDAFEKLAQALVNQAITCADAVDARRVVIFANRVKTARSAYEHLRGKLEGKPDRVDLLIGSMRPIDRDDLYEGSLALLKSGNKRSDKAPRSFVVSTQCLEVGADLDFDVLVTECASFDALQQRFGRLDRMGDFHRARAAIVIGSWQVAPKAPDPIYGASLPNTWRWLQGKAQDGAINMGIESPGEPRTAIEMYKASPSEGMELEGADAPILLPAHLDILVQTNPEPKPSPNVELFLHGERHSPDVNVVWRSDLDGIDPKDEAEVVKLCPPSSPEAMSVPFWVFKRWFDGEQGAENDASDLEVKLDGEQPGAGKQRIGHALVWNGDRSQVIYDSSAIRPGQTIVLRSLDGPWEGFGFIPDGAAMDVADRAAFSVRSAVSLRFHPNVTKLWPQTPTLELLKTDSENGQLTLEDAEELLSTYLSEIATESRQWPRAFLSSLGQLRRKTLDSYPGVDSPFVLRARRPRRKETGNNHKVLLKEHLSDVEGCAGVMASCLDEALRSAICSAARVHDYGKVDIRYQAWLRGGDLMAARFAPSPIAKSGNRVLLKQIAVGLPKGFRHELLSLLFAEKILPLDESSRDLVLHLVASHHGCCRPFAPVLPDPDADSVSFAHAKVSKEERAERAPHKLGSGVPDRFWRLTRMHGWWGLAYLEAVLRLADWQASDKRVSEVTDDE